MKLTKAVPKAVRSAYEAALEARKHSHSPYSHFKVGAAIKIRGIGQAIGGCNVENASYGGTVCAERVALWSAIAAYGKKPIEFVVVTTAEKKPTVPCAFCLQTLAEFAKDNTKIYLSNLEGVQEEVTLMELLPRPFRSFKSDGK